MHVVMRVNVRGQAVHQFLEPLELRPQLFLQPCLEIGDRAAVFAEIHVQADAQLRGVSTERDRFFTSWPVHQKAGARQYAVPVRFQDAAIDAGTRAEIIRIDDQEFHEGTSLRAMTSLGSNSASSAPSNCLASAFVRHSALPRRSTRASAM